MSRDIVSRGYEPDWLYYFFLSMATCLGLAMTLIFLAGGERNIMGQISSAKWPVLPIMAASLAPLAMAWATIEISCQLGLPRFAMIKSGAADALIRLSPPTLADEDNAAVYYQKAASALGQGDENGKSSFKELIIALDGGKEDAGEKAREALNKHKAFLDLAKRGASIKGFHPLENPVLDMEWPNYGSQFPRYWNSREMALVMALEARLLAAEGKTSSALENVHLIYNLGGHVASGPPLLVSSLIGIAIWDIGNIATQKILDRGAPAEFKAIATPVAFQQMNGRLIKNGLAGEFAWQRAGMANLAFYVESLYSGAIMDGCVEGSIAPDCVLKSSMASLAAKLYIIFGLEHDLKFHEMFGKGVLELADKHPAQFIKELAKFQDSVGKQTDDFEIVFAGVDGIKPSYIGGLALPQYKNYIERAYIVEARYYAARTAVAAAAYLAKNKEYPSSLAELAPDYIASIPLDPFNGKPLKLSQVSNGIAIYSIGPDFADNGGSAPKGDAFDDIKAGHDLAVTLATEIKPLAKPVLHLSKSN